MSIYELEFSKAKKDLVTALMLLKLGVSPYILCPDKIELKLDKVENTTFTFSGIWVAKSNCRIRTTQIPLYLGSTLICTQDNTGALDNKVGYIDLFAGDSMTFTYSVDIDTLK